MASPALVLLALLAAAGASNQPSKQAPVVQTTDSTASVALPPAARVTAQRTTGTGLPGSSPVAALSTYTNAGLLKCYYGIYDATEEQALAMQYRIVADVWKASPLDFAKTFGREWFAIAKAVASALPRDAPAVSESNFQNIVTNPAAAGRVFADLLTAVKAQGDTATLDCGRLRFAVDHVRIAVAAAEARAATRVKKVRRAALPQASGAS
jgi:hypothetical protein